MKRGALVLLVVLLAGPALAQRSSLSPAEQKLCIDVCFKQLTCAGQSSNVQALNACTANCQQTIAMRDPIASKPWKASHLCNMRSCGADYASCVAQKMQEPTASERTCKPICDKVIRCSNQFTNPAAHQNCMRGCVSAMDSGDPRAQALQNARGACLKSSCGLKTEVCVASKQGGHSSLCAKACHKRLKCANSVDINAFAQCMPQCVGNMSNATAARRIKLEVKCKGCGLKQAACVAKKTGGNAAMCFRVCEKQLVCAGQSSNTAFLNQCSAACVNAMAAKNPAVVRSYTAVDNCRKKRCGGAFNKCMQVEMRPPPIAAPKADPNMVRCQNLCQRLTQCNPSGAGTGCVTRCMADPNAASEFSAINACQRVRCGKAFDQCVYKKLRVPRKSLSCAPVCKKDLGCQGRQLVTYTDIASCASGCRMNKAQIAASTACAGYPCGQQYAMCVTQQLQPQVVIAPQPVQPMQPVQPIAQPIAQPIQPQPIQPQPVQPQPVQPQPVAQPTPQPIAQPAPQPRPVAKPAPQPVAPKPAPKPVVKISKAERRCIAICEKASECASNAGGDKCVPRCLKDRSARKEFKLREACSSKSCGKYDTCIFGRLKVKGYALDCVPACRHDLSCKRQGWGSDVMAVAACAKRCTKSPNELKAISACEATGCTTAYETCVRFKLRAIEAKAKPAAPKVDPKEARCVSLCKKAEECTVDSGGDSCLKRCDSRAGKKEFSARQSCQAKSCDEYDHCMLRKLGVGKSNVTRCLGACQHELACRPPGEARGLKELVTCTKGCKYDTRELSAISECKDKGCGANFSKCVLAKSGVAEKREAVKATCEELCRKQDECVKGTGDKCIARCAAAGGKSDEIKARKTCGNTDSCDAYADCLYRNAGGKQINSKYVRTCNWDLSCARGGSQVGNVKALVQCTRKAKYDDIELTVRDDCEAMGCGSGFKRCLGSKLKLAIAAARAPKGPTKEEKRCKSLCDQAEKCLPGSVGEACVQRCLDPKTKNEFAAREKCKGSTCTKYFECVLTELGLSSGDQRCAPRCQKELTCKTPANYDMFAVVACSTSCKDSEVEVRAASVCGDKACGSEYNRCWRQAVTKPVLSPKEQQCKTMCDQLEGCTPGLGGQKCIGRCMDKADGWKDEFDARSACAKYTQCKAYDECVVNTLIGGEDSLSAPHTFDLTDAISPGEHTLTVLIDGLVSAVALCPSAEVSAFSGAAVPVDDDTIDVERKYATTFDQQLTEDGTLVLLHYKPGNAEGTGEYITFDAVEDTGSVCRLTVNGAPTGAPSLTANLSRLCIPHTAVDNAYQAAQFMHDADGTRWG